MERALKEGKSLDQQLTQLSEQEITPALLSMESAGGEGEQQRQSARGNGRGNGRGRSRRESGSGRRAHA